MERIQRIQHKEKEIIYVDYGGLREPEMIQLLNKVEVVILSNNRPHLQLTNISNAFATPGFMAAAKEFGKRTQHLTEKSAILGITGVKALLLRSYSLVSGINMRAFNTLEEAKDYLVE